MKGAVQNKFLYHGFRKIKRRLRPLKVAYCHVTAKKRALPDFIIAGAMKSGTSSLFLYLRQHPQIIGSRKKEVHFFDWHYAKGEDWYRSFFPLSHTIKQGELTGEATPLYIFCPPIPERIFNLIPDVKLIFLLRNPTERVISHYFHSVRAGQENLSLMDALLAEEERTAAAWRKASQGECTYNEPLIWFTYKRRGLYLEQLERYWRYFDMDRVFLVNSEDLMAKPQETSRKIFSFLEVDPSFEIPDLTRKHVADNRKKVPVEVYQYLDVYFRPYNELLYERTGQDFGWNV